MNKFSKYLLIALSIALIGFLAWYFKSIIIYIAAAVVVALIGRPLMKLLKKIHIKKFRMPSWLAAIITIVIILGIFFSLFFLLTPLISQIVQQTESINLEDVGSHISRPLSKFNAFIIRTFPGVDENFRIEMYALNEVKNMLSISTFSSIFTSITSFIIDFGIAIFSIVFISFFLLVDEGLLTNLLTSIFADKYEESIRRASNSISNLLTRYFLGISVESLCIALLNGIGLIFIAKMDTTLAIVLAFLSGFFNIIPYVGPLAGDILAVIMGLFTHSTSGLNSSLGIYLLVILAIFICAQLIDNYVFQPFIYSSSVKAHPLEIFIVILLAGHIGGILGMFIAIPSYTVLRVIASEFLPRFKFVQKLTKNLQTNKDSAVTTQDNLH